MTRFNYTHSTPRTHNYQTPFPQLFDDTVTQLQKMNMVSAHLRHMQQQIDEMIVRLNNETSHMHETLQQFSLELQSFEEEVMKEIKNFERNMYEQYMPDSVEIILQKWLDIGKFADILNNSILPEINESVERNTTNLDLRSLNMITLGADGTPENDTLAFQTAIEIVRDNPSIKHIFFPYLQQGYHIEGDHFIYEFVELSSNKANVYVDGRWVFASDNTVSGFEFDNRHASNGLRFMGKNSVIENNSFYNSKARDEGLTVSVDIFQAENVIVRNNLFEGLESYTQVGTGDEIAARSIRSWYSKNIDIIYNTFRGGIGYADTDYVHVISSLTPDLFNFPWKNADFKGYFEVSDIRIENNVFDHHKVKSCLKIQTSKVNIVGNTINVNSEQDSTLYSRPIRIYNAKNIKLTNNNIYVEGAKMNCVLDVVPCEDVDIFDNTFVIKNPNNVLNPFWFNFKQIKNLKLERNKICIVPQGTSFLFDGIENGLIKNNVIEYIEVPSADYNMFYPKQTAQGDECINMVFDDNYVTAININPLYKGKIVNSGVIRGIQFFDNNFTIPTTFEFSHISQLTIVDNYLAAWHTLLTLTSVNSESAFIDITNNMINNVALAPTQQFLFLRGYGVATSVKIRGNRMTKMIDPEMIDVAYNTNANQQPLEIYYEKGDPSIRDIGPTGFRNPYRKYTGTQFYDTTQNIMFVWENGLWRTMSLN